MTPKAKKSALVLSGAVALAFGGYAIGSESGSGTASATNAKGSPPSDVRPTFARGGFGRGRGFAGPDLTSAAQELGVSETALRDALIDARRDLAPRDDRRDERVAELAKALGISEAKVRAAFDQVKPERGHRLDDLAATLAKKLGVSATKVEDAFDTLRRSRPDSREDAQAALAKAIGVSEAKLEDAFRSLKQDFRRDRPERREGKLSELAKALGVSQAKLETALKSLHGDREGHRGEIEDALAASVAKTLKLDVAKVKAALEDLGPRRGPGPGFRHP